MSPFRIARSRFAIAAAMLLPLASSAQSGMARIPAGSYVPLYASEPGKPAAVGAFQLDRNAVTRREYLGFIRTNAMWQRGRPAAVYADAGYLADWPGPLDFGSATPADRPITSVSWFAARAYCESKGKRLPTVDEWEYAAAASEKKRDATRDPLFIRRLLDLYSARSANPAPAAHPGFRNIYGVNDLHGSAWEWTEDFNSVLVSGDSREAGGTSKHTDFRAVCAGGAIGASDPANYPAFLRFAFRAALNGRSNVRALGFRCAAGA